MSNLVTMLRRLLARLSVTGPAPVDPDALSPRDWADLPTHHPSRDRAPC